jgi:ferredoxin/flavodoxin
MERIVFYYFSGTGNTLLVVKQMKEVFEDEGINVELHKMEDSTKEEFADADLIGLAFPVAIQGTYPLVWKFIKSLPKTNGTKIFMVDTLESFSGGVVGPVKRILKSKGYAPIAAKEIKMPRNLLNKKIDKDENSKKISNGLGEAKNYVYDILNSNTSWKRVPVLSDLISLFSKSKLLWKMTRNIFKVDVDETKCVKCKTCSKLCPVENVTMQEYPNFGDKCIFCMRCVSYCPVQAIDVKVFNKPIQFERYSAVRVSEFLSRDD